jgi:hypothetical protein
MEVPLQVPGSRATRPVLIACAEADYLHAQRDDLPERWLRAQRKG